MVYGVLCDCNGTELERFFIGPHGETTQSLFVRSGYACFPKKYYMTNYHQAMMDFNAALAKGDEYFTWNYTYCQKDVYYLKYELVEEFGCPHFSSSCQIFCSVCNQFYDCKYCHDEACALEKEHVLSVVKLKCKSCGYVINNTNTQLCPNCKSVMYKFKCTHCGVFVIHEQCFHSAEINKCVFGDQSRLYLCHGCDQYIPKNEAAYHDVFCQSLDDEICPICQGSFDQMLLKPGRLNCGHYFHRVCIQNQLFANPNSPCPICRLQMRTTVDHLIYKQKWLSIYAITEVPESMLNNMVSVECLMCGLAYTTHQHPLGYICPECGEIMFRLGTGQKSTKAVVRETKPYALCRLDDRQAMQSLIDVYSKALAQFISEVRANYTKCAEQTDRYIIETFFLVNELDRHICFAALNLLNFRLDVSKYSAQQLHRMMADTFAEVREIKRLKLDQDL